MRVRRHSGSITGRGQGGIALLVFMLVLLVGSSYMLLTRLNEYAQTYARDTQTRLALLKAKKALLNYAMNYPELNNHPERGPGYLPCPDEGPDPVPTPTPTSYTDSLNDGVAETNCSDSSGSTFGRLPYADLGLPVLTDSSGERLWYGVSQNFKLNQPSTNILNSETPGTICVDGTGPTCAGGTGDVVAVIIAPGEPLPNQKSRHGTAELNALLNHQLYTMADQYVEGENAVTGDATYVTTGSGEFNDQVVTITRAELMQYVQKRVLAEAGNALASYQNSTGKYPALAPFADPKADARWVQGTHSGNDSSASLVDSSAEFADWGVSSGDLVWNISDGSVGKVTGVSANTLTIGAGMSGGTRNDFDNGDEYLVELNKPAAILSGTATSGSSGTTLEDTAGDFSAPLVAPGDIVDDVTDGSSGRVDSVDNDSLTVAKLSGGANNAFTPGDDYRIRNNAGIATSGSTGTTLYDSSVNFQTMGVKAGALVRDLTDGSFGQVTSTGAHTLTVSSLNMGANDAFSPGDEYSISRYYPATNTTEGLLPIQEPGQAFASGFTMDWALSSSSYVDVTGGLDTTYRNSIRSLVQSSANNNSTLSVSATDGRCIWVDQAIADCRGSISDPNFLSGTVTGQSGSYLTDSSQNFSATGIKRGDKVVNTSDSTAGIVRSVPSATTLQISNISGYASLNHAVGQPYRVYTASHSISGHASWGSQLAPYYKMYASGADLSTVKVGDVIENTTWNAIGMVTGVNAGASPPYVTYTPLQGGMYPDIYYGEAYTIHTQYVAKRLYEFQVRMKGTVQSTTSSGIRTRTVCIGYDSSCNGTSAAAVFPINSIAPQISLLDYDSSGAPVGTATAPKTGTSPTGSLRISGIIYPLTADDSMSANTPGNLPSWFIKNRWQQLVYVAYSGLYGPGGTGSLLQVNVQTPPSTLDSIQSLVIAAGPQMDSQAEDRTTGQLDAYFESGNASSGDDDFGQKQITDPYNDQVQIICPNNSPRPAYTCP